MSRVLVRFLKSYMPFSAGHVAAFEKDYAIQLEQKGIGVIEKGEVKSAPWKKDFIFKDKDRKKP